MTLYETYLERCPGLMTQLERARRSGRFAHAFLVCADDEATRREFPVVLAELAGTPASREVDVRGDYCARLERGVYAEYYTLTPVGKMYQIQVGDRENPEPNTLRRLLDQLYLTSTTAARRKLGVILDADRLNVEAQNALLKTLEEPPADTTIILATANPAALLPTTRSRCQRLTVPALKFSFDFPGAAELFTALRDLVFGNGGLLEAELGAGRLIALAGKLSAAAEAQAKSHFKPELQQVARAEDPAATKRLEERIKNAGFGLYMSQRRQFLGAIGIFCSQVYMLSQGVVPDQLPVPEVLGEHPERLTPPDPEQGELIRREGAALEYTLHFNVAEELALRTFAVNLAGAAAGKINASRS